MSNAITFRYFKSVEGRVVPRFGQRSYIGCRRGPQGFAWSDQAVSIPAIEVVKYLREYNRALADGSLVEVSKAQYDKEQAGITAAKQAAAEQAQATQAKSAKATKKAAEA